MSSTWKRCRSFAIFCPSNGRIAEAQLSFDISAQWYGQMTAAPKTRSEDTAGAELELDADSLDAIRSILTEEDKPAPRRSLLRAKSADVELPREVAPLRSKADSLPPLESPVTDSEEAMLAQKSAKRGFSLRRSPKAEVVKDKAPRKQRAAPREAVAAGQGPLDRLRGFRPKPAHIALAVLALFVIMRPWLVIGLLVLFLIIMTGVFLMVGYDGFWQGTIKFGRWYASRRPHRAEILHARLDRFAVGWDAILDRFPEGTVDGLYLPDFGEMASAEDRHSEAMDRRLAGMHGKGA